MYKQHSNAEVVMIPRKYASLEYPSLQVPEMPKIVKSSPVIEQIWPSSESASFA